jgi:hypothetical protein
MQDIGYYREQAARARRLARCVVDAGVAKALRQAAQDFDDIAADLEAGAIEVRHPSRLPQLDRVR